MSDAGAPWPRASRPTTVSGGGGGGTAAVDWGPDFGDLGLNAEADVSLAALETTYGDLAVSTAVGLGVEATFAEIVAAAVSRIHYDIDWLAGGTTATNEGADNWQNPDNATDLRDGAEASRSGSVGGQTGILRLDYADPTGGGLSTFTIDLVELRFDTRQTGTALNNGGLHHEYRLDPADSYTVLQSFTGDIDNNPATYDITANVGGSWTKLNNLQTRVRAQLGTGTSLVSCFCDAVEVHILAHEELVSP